MRRWTSIACLVFTFGTGACNRGTRPAGGESSNRLASRAAGTEARTKAASEACGASELDLQFDGRDGSFTGMSHDGALLVLRNTGTRGCSVAALPRLSFTDGAGKPVELAADVRPEASPGPAPLPVRLAPGASASGKMQWVMGDVYGGGHCVYPQHALLQLDGSSITRDFRAHVCAPTGETPVYQQEWLRPGSNNGSPDAAQ